MVPPCSNLHVLCANNVTLIPSIIFTALKAPNVYGASNMEKVRKYQNWRRQTMSKFILGIVITLAVLYPAVTKTIFGKAVDTTHTVVTKTIEDNK
jgi:hypothetical protein